VRNNIIFFINRGIQKILAIIGSNPQFIALVIECDRCSDRMISPFIPFAKDRTVEIVDSIEMIFTVRTVYMTEEYCLQIWKVLATVKEFSTAQMVTGL